MSDQMKPVREKRIEILRRNNVKKDPAVFLGHILDSIELIESYSRGKTEAGFDGFCWPTG